MVLASRYELGPLVGRGGSAEVHRAHDHILGREVAVKVFGRGVEGPDRRRQDHELHALARMHHSGLVELHDAGTQNGRAFLVMQLVDGPTLTQHLGGRAQAPTAAAALGRDLADALGYVHAHGITHRDVKPGNILVARDGRPMLSDFGIALLVGTTRVTATGAVLGTPAYMAPEQVRGEPVGSAADVYALGLIVLEALTGRQEFPGGATESALARLHRDPVVPALPAGLTPLLQAMTDARPEARPAALEVVEALDAAIAELRGGLVATPGRTPACAHTASAAPAVAPNAGPGPDGPRGLVALTAPAPTTPALTAPAPPGAMSARPAAGPGRPAAGSARPRRGQKVALVLATCAVALGLGSASLLFPDATPPAMASVAPPGPLTTAPGVLPAPGVLDPTNPGSETIGDTATSATPSAAGNTTGDSSPNAASTGGAAGGDRDTTGDRRPSQAGGSSVAQPTAQAQPTPQAQSSAAREPAVQAPSSAAAEPTPQARSGAAQEPAGQDPSGASAEPTTSTATEDPNVEE